MYGYKVLHLVLMFIFPFVLLHNFSLSLLFSQAESELRIAQSEFDRQYEITKLLLEGITSAHVSFSSPGSIGKGVNPPTCGTFHPNFCIDVTSHKGNV